MTNLAPFLWLVGFSFKELVGRGFAYDSASLFNCPQGIGKLHGNHFEEIPISCGNFTIGKGKRQLVAVGNSTTDILST